MATSLRPAAYETTQPMRGTARVGSSTSVWGPAGGPPTAVGVPAMRYGLPQLFALHHSSAPQPGPGGVVHSYEEALNALELAERLELKDPVLRAADLLVYPVLTRDRQAMAELVVNTLCPLTTARGGAQPLLDTLSAYFDSGCVAAEAARRLTLSVRALTYRLERSHKLTGANPADPTHRYMLQTAVIGARLLDWPAQEL